MNAFVAYPSPWRRMKLCLGGIGLFITALWMIGVFGPPPTSPRYSPEILLLAGWAGVFLFGPGAAIMAIRIFEKGEQLRIDAHGVRYPNWSSSTIPWRDIDDVTIWSCRRYRSIILHLRDPSRYPRHGSVGLHLHIGRMLTGGGDVSISLAGADRSVDDAMAAIVRLRYARPAPVRSPNRRFGNRSVG